MAVARTGIPHGPECGALVSEQTPQQMVDALLQYPERNTIPDSRAGRPWA
jgi:Excinuclease ATPase subunit